LILYSACLLSIVNSTSQVKSRNLHNSSPNVSAPLLQNKATSDYLNRIEISREYYKLEDHYDGRDDEYEEEDIEVEEEEEEDEDEVVDEEEEDEDLEEEEEEEYDEETEGEEEYNIGDNVEEGSPNSSLYPESSENEDLEFEQGEEYYDEATASTPDDSHASISVSEASIEQQQDLSNEYFSTESTESLHTEENSQQQAPTTVSFNSNAVISGNLKLTTPSINDHETIYAIDNSGALANNGDTTVKGVESNFADAAQTTDKANIILQEEKTTKSTVSLDVTAVTSIENENLNENDSYAESASDATSSTNISGGQNEKLIETIHNPYSNSTTLFTASDAPSSDHGHYFKLFESHHDDFINGLINGVRNL
jgi:hypothetical protein